MAETIGVVAKDLRALAKQLDNKSLGRALRNALQKESRRVRGVALRNLRQTPIHYTGPLSKTLSYGKSKNALGIYVSSRASKKTGRGMHRTMSGRKSGEPELKPILMWFTDGTAPRKTRKGQYRGFIGNTKYGQWLRKAEQSESPKVNNNIFKEIEKQVEKQARKHGFL